MQCSQNYFKFFLPQEAGAFTNNKEKQSQKPRPKLKIHIFQFLERIFALKQSSTSGSFLQTCISFVEKQLKFSHFEGSIIP